MTRFRIFLARLSALFQRRRLEQDLDVELRSHIEMQIENNLRAGMAPADARQDALRSFGGIGRTKDIHRDLRGIPVLETVLQDFRYSLRRLVSTPAYTIVAVLTLTLVIGATVSMFSLLDRVVFRPLDVADPSSLVVVQQIVERRGAELRRMGMSWAFYQQLISAPMSTLDGFAAFSGDGADRLPLINDALTVNTRALFATANYFRLFGVSPSLGRDFEPADDVRGAVPATILSYNMWRTRFGADAGTIGRTIHVSGVAVRIVGVAPRNFSIPDLSAPPPDLFFPLMTASQVLSSGRSQTDGRGRMFTGSGAAAGTDLSPISPIGNLTIVGRMKEGNVLQQAQAEFSSAAGASNGESLTALTDATLPFQSSAELMQFLALLAAAVGLTLLIGCANFASLLLSRVEERRAELAVRAAIGGTRTRLFQGLVIEAAMVAVAGGVAGLLFAQWIDYGLAVFALPGGISVSWLRSGIDARTILFTAAVTAIATIMISLGPAWRGATVNLAVDFKRRSGSPRLATALSLVGLQVTLSVVLVFGAILFVRSVSEALSSEVGFDPGDLVSVYVNPLQLITSGDAVRAITSIDSFAEQVRALPGISNATVGPMPLLQGSDSSEDEVRVDGVRMDTRTPLEVTYIGPHYFTTLRQPVVLGRDFNDGDAKGSSLLAIVNESVARRFWPDKNPLGGQISFPPYRYSITVVGVVRDAKLKTLRDEGRPAIYLARQSQASLTLAGRLYVAGQAPLILRIENSRALPIALVRAAAAETGLSVGEVVTMDQQLDTLLMPQRLGRGLMTMLGAIALLLASVGIYGLVSCTVARCEKEIGVRRALGASTADAVQVIARRTLWPVLAGMVAGAALAWWGGHFADRFMYGIAGSDPASIILAVAALAIATTAAALLPARRALRINPVDVLRAE